MWCLLLVAASCVARTAPLTTMHSASRIQSRTRDKRPPWPIPHTWQHLAHASAVNSLYLQGLRKYQLHLKISTTFWFKLLWPSDPIWRHWIGPALFHYNEVIMGAIASQITSLTIVYSTVYSDADQRKHQSSASLAFVRGNSPVSGEFPAQMASKAENVYIWWRHHGSGNGLSTFRQQPINSTQ